MTKNKRNVYHPIPYATIEAATFGDQLAMRIVLSIYKDYIASLCLKTVYKEDGTVSVCVDDFMRRRLESKLIAKVTEFDINR